MVRYVPVVQDIINLVQKEVGHVMSFVRNPSQGIFETIDRMITDARVTVRKYLPVKP